MPKNVIETLVKILLASFALGLILSFFEINPKDLLANFGETVQKVFSLAADWVSWGVKYVLLGAVIVVPIWAIVFLIGRFRGK